MVRGQLPLAEVPVPRYDRRFGPTLPGGLQDLEPTRISYESRGGLSRKTQ